MDLLNNAESKMVKKGTILLRKGELCKVAYRVTKGCLRSYVIDKTGKERIFQFAPEDWIVADMDSYYNKKPSVLYIDAIEDSEVMLLDVNIMLQPDNIPKEILIELMSKLQRNLISTNKRLLGMLSATAEERYVEFTETYPALMNRLPLKQIASYLGITPEYLSDIRRKLARK